MAKKLAKKESRSGLPPRKKVKSYARLGKSVGGNPEVARMRAKLRKKKVGIPKSAIIVARIKRKK
jgi:hypothetical protein